ncbi:ATP-binding protein [Pseudoalteromonas mariniglutinosa]|uniref:ATP-binding protein n=1 Tax=Pseudoalteromonas mariniglutinosa TaxID=206042 RepID=UPI00384D4D11
MLSKIKISHKLWLLIAIPILGMCLLLTYTISHFNYLENDIKSLYKNRIIPLVQIKKVSDEGAIQIVDLLHKHRAGLIDASEVAALIRQAQAEMRLQWQGYLNTYLVNEEKAKIALIEYQMSEVFALVDRYLDNIATQQIADIAEAEFSSQLYRVFDPLTAELQTLVEVQNKVALNIVNDTAVQFQLLKTMLLALSGIVIVLLLLAGFLLSRSIHRPIKQIHTQINQIIDNSDLEKRITLADHNELNDVAIAVNSLLNHIQNIQGQLIESEKLSSLGSLVSGLAHEINTPLGISITAISTCQSQVGELEGKVKAQRLSEAKFIAYMEQLDSGLDLAERNLTKTAKLVQEFKNLSAEQDDHQQTLITLEPFLREYCEQTALFQFKQKVNFKLKNNHPTPVQVKSKVLQQVLFQLIDNAIAHGLSMMEDKDREVTLSLEYLADSIRIDITDNGKGIHNEQLPRIFEPFYTTARHNGHAGLGLTVTYNLVKKHLNGELEISSEPLSGTTVTIILAKHNDIELPTKIAS